MRQNSFLKLINNLQISAANIFYTRKWYCYCNGGYAASIGWFKTLRRMERDGRLLGGISSDNVDESTNIILKMGWEALIEVYKKIKELLVEKLNERVCCFTLFIGSVLLTVIEDISGN